MSLETVDLSAVEILDAGVTIHGRGSPPGGDRYSVADLRAIAQANRELEGELKPPAKIGHEGHGPAVGRLENVRVSGSKLLADVKRVPRRFAELVRAGAFPSRSVELSRITSTTGRRFDLAVSALAFLGDRLPAVHGLADIEALYEGEAVLVRAYELEPDLDVDMLLENAVETGRIAVGSVETWRRSFEAAPELARETLERTQPGPHRRMENRRVLLNASDCSDELVRAHEIDLANQLGVSVEELL